MVRVQAINSQNLTDKRPVFLENSFTWDQLKNEISRILGWNVGSVAFGRAKQTFSDTTARRTVGEFRLTNDEPMLCVILRRDGCLC